MQKEIHILGIDPGAGTGWCRLTVPRESIFGTEQSRIVEWDYGCLYGEEEDQVSALCQLVLETQGLAYKLGPALMVEDWDQDPSFKSTDREALSPVRIGAMLRYCLHIGKMGDATLSFQGRTQAKGTATDARLKAWGLYVAGPDHQRDAIRHAIVGLRRARENPALAAVMWPYAAAYKLH
jgi:hypothetical protein